MQQGSCPATGAAGITRGGGNLGAPISISSMNRWSGLRMQGLLVGAQAAPGDCLGGRSLGIVVDRSGRESQPQRRARRLYGSRAAHPLGPRCIPRIPVFGPARPIRQGFACALCSSPPSSSSRGPQTSRCFWLVAGGFNPSGFGNECRHLRSPGVKISAAISPALGSASLMDV